MSIIELIHKKYRTLTPEQPKLSYLNKVPDENHHETQQLFHQREYSQDLDPQNALCLKCYG